MELLYKVFKGDTRLVRSLLQANSFQHTEGHDWNILWASGNCKLYLYEGLNEWQKINHFPNSFELTRKDKLAINVRKMQQRYGNVINASPLVATITGSSTAGSGWCCRA